MKTQLYVERLWEILTGDYPPALPREIPILTSLCFYALNLVLGRQLRLMVRTTLPQRLVPYVLDAVTAFQLMACSLENSQIRKHYGDAAYVGIMFSIGMWSFMTISDARSNPCAHVIKYMQGRHTIPSFCLHVLCQLIGGLASFPYARLFWSLELTESHGHRYRKLHCTTDLTVPSFIGFFLEFGATYMDVLLCLTTFTPYLFYEVATKTLIGCIVVILGVDLTGMYANPINATNQTFGCRGINPLEHIFVYWCSVFLAGALGVITHKHLGQCWKMVKQEKLADEAIPIKGSESRIYSGKLQADTDSKDGLRLRSSVKRNADVNENNEANKSNNSNANLEGFEAEIWEKIEHEVIEDEVLEMSEDEIFKATEDSVMKDDVQMEDDVDAGNLNEKGDGKKRSKFGPDFEAEFEEMRRQEKIHDMQNANVDLESRARKVGGKITATQTRIEAVNKADVINANITGNEAQRETTQMKANITGNEAQRETTQMKANITGNEAQRETIQMKANITANEVQRETTQMKANITANEVQRETTQMKANITANEVQRETTQMKANIQNANVPELSSMTNSRRVTRQFKFETKDIQKDELMKKDDVMNSNTPAVTSKSPETQTIKAERIDTPGKYLLTRANMPDMPKVTVTDVEIEKKTAVIKAVQRQRKRSTSGSRIPVRKRSTSRSKIPVKMDHSASRREKKED